MQDKYIAPQAPAVAARNPEDPFLTNDAMDTGEDFSPNYSSIRPPLPSEMKEPMAPAAEFYVITVGQPVGVLTDISGIAIHSQAQFAMSRCTNWYQAVGYYTVRYHEGRVHLVPADAPPCQEVSIPHLAASRDVSYVLSTFPTPIAGSAANPIYINTPVFNRVLATSEVQNATTPTPASRTIAKGKGVAKRGAPLIGLLSAARKANQRLKLNQLKGTTVASASSSAVTVCDEEIEDLPRYLSQQTVARQSHKDLAYSHLASAVSQDCTNPEKPVSQPALPPRFVIDVSDVELEDNYLPRYPKALIKAAFVPDQESGAQGTISAATSPPPAGNLRQAPYPEGGIQQLGAPSHLSPQNSPASLLTGSASDPAQPSLQKSVQSTMSTKPVESAAVSSSCKINCALHFASGVVDSTTLLPLASPNATHVVDATTPSEIGDTPPVGNKKPFTPLFADLDGSDGGVHPDFAHILNSNVRYRLTTAGRRAVHATAEHPSPIAGPSNLRSASASMNTGHLISEPSNAIAHNSDTDALTDDDANNGDGAHDGAYDDADDTDESDYRLSDIDPAHMDEVGHLLDTTEVVLLPLWEE